MKMLYVRPLVAAILAVTLVGGPISPAFAQETPQNPQAAPAKTAAPIVPVSLGSAKYNYSRAPKAFPSLLAPYSPIKIEQPNLTNSPRIDQLIHDGKLELGLQDAVELALENSMDIVVARYYPWLADTSILKTKAGGFGFGTPGAFFAGSTANNPFLNYDPLITSTLSIDDRNIPVNNPLTSGTGTGLSTLARLTLHTSTFNTQYSQGFHTGTTLFSFWDNTRTSSTSAANLFNPAVTSSIYVGFQQQVSARGQVGVCGGRFHRNAGTPGTDRSPLVRRSREGSICEETGTAGRSTQPAELRHRRQSDAQRAAADRHANSAVWKHGVGRRRSD